MAINQLIAQGIRPIGADLPAIGQMLQQRKDAEQRNKLAELAAQTDAKNAESYGQSLQAQTAAREAATREQEATRAREWLTNAVTSVRQNPGLIPVLVREGKQRGILTPETPDALTPEQVEEFALANGIAPPQQTPTLGVQNVGGFRVLRDSTGKVINSLAPQRAPAAAAPRPQLIDVRLPDGSTQKQWVAPGQASGTPVGAPIRPPESQPPKPSAQEMKAQRDARQKLPTVDAALRRVERLAAASENLGGTLADGGPIDGVILSRTRSGQELIQSAASLMPALTALTRVPGIGAQSDLEQRLAQLQLPDPSMYPEVRAKAVEELRIFMNDLRNAYLNAAGMESSAAPASGNGGWSIQEIP